MIFEGRDDNSFPRSLPGLYGRCMAPKPGWPVLAMLPLLHRLALSTLVIRDIFFWKASFSRTRGLFLQTAWDLTVKSVGEVWNRGKQQQKIFKQSCVSSSLHFALFWYLTFGHSDESYLVPVSIILSDRENYQQHNDVPGAIPNLSIPCLYIVLVTWFII